MAFVIGCNKDSELGPIEENTIVPPIENLSPIESSVVGYVYDTNNLPVSNALISSYFGSTRTDENGVFKFENTKLDPHGSYIKVEKEGYILGSDKLFPTSGSSYSSIQLIPLTSSNSFSTSTGGQIEAANGGGIQFNPGSLVYEDGSSYDGNVLVTAHFISPNNDNIGDIMPGDLVADAANGNTVILGTAGMMAVELRDQENNELNLAEGSTAQIKFPKESADFPSEIPLWSFDESRGRWQEEGTAITEGDYYVAEVSHFSFWNCDVPFPLINLCGKVVTQNGTPVKTRIDISTNGFGSMYGYTDENGEFCGKVPKDVELTIRVKDVFCSSAAVTTVKGPFDVNTVLDDIVIEDLLPVIEGEVQCQGQLYDNSTVLLQSQNRTFVINNINQGSFNVNLNTLCSDIQSLEIEAYNNEDKMASQAQIVDLNDPSFYELEVCLNPCDFEGELIYECGSSNMQINVLNGTGTYSFEWSTGDTGGEIDLANGINSYCVTVTEDLSGCTKEYCQEAADGPISVSSSYEVCDGVIYGFISKGVAPFKITSDSGQDFETNFSNFTLVASGNGEVICFTITDKNNCIASDCVTTGPIDDYPYIDSRPYGCDLNKYFFNTSEIGGGWLEDVQGNTYPVENITFPFEIDVTVTGYAIKKAVLWSFSGCEAQYDIVMPFFNGLVEVTPNDTSCGGCEDGSFEIDIDPDAECYECAYGEVRVYKSDTFEDVTEQNDTQTLLAGSYYVAAIDSVSNCFIAHELLEIK